MADAPIAELRTDGRDSLGRFGSGNTAAMTHGPRRSLDRPDVQVLIVEEMNTAIEALGGLSELSPQMLRVVKSYARNAVLSDCAFEQMVATGGLVTNKGKNRPIAAKWQQLDETAVKRAIRLGLERRTKQAMTLEQVMRPTE